MLAASGILGERLGTCPLALALAAFVMSGVERHNQLVYTFAMLDAGTSNSAQQFFRR